MSLEKHNNPRIFGLDVVRALAILLVVFSHIHYLIGSDNPLLISISGLFGFAGVELFFVLSGFLIGSILLKMFLSENFSKQNLFVFLKRRWFRTLPVYYLVLIINIALASFFAYDTNGWWQYFVFIQNFSVYDITVFAESWSLSIEEWTYLIAPLTMFFGYRIFRNNKKFGFLFISIVLIVFFHWMRYRFYLNNKVSDMQTWNLVVKSVVAFRVDAIVMGFLVAWAHCFYKEAIKKYCVYLLIISFHLFFLQFVVLNVLGVDIISSSLYFTVFYFTFSSLTIALGMPFFVNWETSKGLVAKTVRFVSKVSYSVYLLHYSVVAVLMKYFFDVPKFSGFQLYGFVLAYLFIVFFLSNLLYNYFEKPIMDLRDKNNYADFLKLKPVFLRFVKIKYKN